MTAASLGTLPGGAPDWLAAVWGVVVILVALFGKGFGATITSSIRNRRAGLATRETEARQQEREFRAAERTAGEQETDRVIARMGEQLEQQGSTIDRQGREIGELRETVRAMFAREQSTMANLFAHAVWDHAVDQYLPEDFPSPPPLMPARIPTQDQQHSTEWGHAGG